MVKSIGGTWFVSCIEVVRNIVAIIANEGFNNSDCSNVK